MTSSPLAIVEPAAAPLPRAQSGAYAIIQDRDGRLLTIVAENGRTYLPGGRLEPGETARRALVREIAEECGWAATVEARVASARQCILDDSVDLDATFWRARLMSPLATPAEHDLLWLDPAEALPLLHRDCDRQAVRQALGLRIAA